MASTYVTVPNHLLSLKKTNIPSRSNHRLLGLRKLTVRVNSIASKWEPTKVVPQADRVLNTRASSEDLRPWSLVCRWRSQTIISMGKSACGVLLPKAAVKFERYLMGEILTVGTDVGPVDAGKKVLFSDISAYEVDLETDEKHCFVKESDLLAAVE